jgi:hypothetical protein
MIRAIRRQGPALVLAVVALVAALTGSVYAAAKINGRAIKPKSIPGNRVVPGSLPANRLKRGAIPGSMLVPGSITGSQIDAATLGRVPEANHAESADSARDAETALNAVNAVDATRVNGYEAGCKAGTRPFAGACWQVAANGTALKAPDAAAACANAGGELPEALMLSAFSKQPGVTLEAEEWSGDLTNVSGPNLYATITVNSSGAVSSALPTETKKFRCVIPLLG